jgi:hypothetical protein
LVGVLLMMLHVISQAALFFTGRFAEKHYLLDCGRLTLADSTSIAV